MTNTTQIRGCTVRPSTRGLPICLPAFTIINSPVQFSVVPVDPLPIEAIKIYVDGVARVTTEDDGLSTRLNLPLGDHHVEVKAPAPSVSFGTMSSRACTAVDFRSLQRQF